MSRVFSGVGVALLVLTFGAGCATTSSDSTVSSTKTMPWTYQGKLPDDQIVGKQARIETNKGTIVFELLPDVAPLTVSNFVYLANGGYYNGLTFHRRVEGFVIQGGDPQGDGTGGPGYTIPDEFNSTPHDRGVVAMAKTPYPDSAGSQFYITLADVHELDGSYTVFGRVLSGMDVVDQIQVGDIMTKVTIEDKP